MFLLIYATCAYIKRWQIFWRLQKQIFNSNFFIQNTLVTSFLFTYWPAIYFSKSLTWIKLTCKIITLAKMTMTSKSHLNKKHPSVPIGRFNALCVLSGGAWKRKRRQNSNTDDEKHLSNTHTNNHNICLATRSRPVHDQSSKDTQTQLRTDTD